MPRKYIKKKQHPTLPDIDFTLQHYNALIPAFTQLAKQPYQSPPDQIPNPIKRILSLFDLSGSWSEPYKSNGYAVTRIDEQLNIKLSDFNYRKLPRTYFYGILIAQPCTDFAISGRKYFIDKDNDGRTLQSLSLLLNALAIVQYFAPALKFWTLENPASRIHNLCPLIGRPQLMFNPHDFAGYADNPSSECYSKKTFLYGNFNAPTRSTQILPDELYNWHNKVGGASTQTKNFRSKTPQGFARAFFLANP